MGKPLSTNMEDYLRTIHVLKTRRGSVRVKDIAENLGITMPSVCSALKNLEGQGLVNHERYDRVILTGKGERVAADMVYRHRVIRDFLHDVLGIDHSIAEKDACGMEHSISPETLQSLIQFMASAGTGQR